ncbi:MAG TPA: BrnA antitoxin family protein [Longimicrobiaceae bacterium]|nr:BrnA antitoxin family protein [Longimicrobiaceae bacterium]
MPSYKRDELPEGRTDWARVRSMPDEEKQAIAESDTDNPLWTREAFEEAELVLPGGHNQVYVSMRVDQEVLDAFRAAGPGYQTRMSDVLRSWVRGELRPVERHDRVERLPDSAHGR